MAFCDIPLPDHAGPRVVRRDDETNGVPNRDAHDHERGNLQGNDQRPLLIPPEAMRTLLHRPSNPSMALLTEYADAHFSSGMEMKSRGGREPSFIEVTAIRKTVYRMIGQKTHTANAACRTISRN